MCVNPILLSLSLIVGTNSDTARAMQSTTTEVTKLSLDDHPSIQSMECRSSLAESEVPGRPTLIDVLYSTPSEGSPVDHGASEAAVRRKAANKEQYLYRRTAKVSWCYMYMAEARTKSEYQSLDTF